MKILYPKILVSLIIVFGIFLRILPGFENIIWSYDQARDSVVIRSIFGEKNLIIVGPQTEYVGLSHGPLYYYLLAPFYYLGQTNFTLPILAMIALNLSAIIPLFLFAKRIFKSNVVGILAVFLFTFSYQQIEYSRWLSNVSITIPLLFWHYYFLFETLRQKTITRKSLFLSGLFLALSIQGEIFLLYLIPINYLFYFLTKKKFGELIFWHIGLILGLLSFLIAEIRFGFLASKTFVGQFLAENAGRNSIPADGLLAYLNHLGLTAYQNLIGLNSSMGLLLFFLGIFYISQVKAIWKKEFESSSLFFLLTVLFSHSILFCFRYVDSVFLDLSILMPMILLFVGIIFTIYKSDFKFIAYGLVFLSFLSQILLYYSNTKNQTPMQTYNFHQGAILFSQKKTIVAKIYELVNTSNNENSQKFTLGVLGSPFGVQTTWATIFENYLAENPLAIKPDWYGFHAFGYPYDSYFTKVDHPMQTHVVVIEDNMLGLTNKKIIDDYLAHADESTKIILEEKITGFIIQIRKRIN